LFQTVGAATRKLHGMQQFFVLRGSVSFSQLADLSIWTIDAVKVGMALTADATESHQRSLALSDG